MAIARRSSGTLHSANRLPIAALDAAPVETTDEAVVAIGGMADVPDEVPVPAAEFAAAADRGALLPAGIGNPRPRIGTSMKQRMP